MIKPIVLFCLASAATTHAFVSRPSVPATGPSVSSSALEAQKTAVVAGASGYIGKSVVREAVRQGYQTIALVRDASKVTTEQGKASFGGFFDGAQVVECDVTDADDLTRVMKDITASSGKVDAIVSCLASRSGVKKDAYLIDYQATLNCLEAGRAAKAGHFVLLSAFCVKNPWLQFQQAKLKFEAALQSQQDMSWSIVRPTAFFKSVSGQLEVCKSGAPYVMFGDGKVTRCNPIAESDLATYLMDCVTDKSRHQKIINLGGPDEPLTMKMQGEMLFRALDMEPKYFNAPLWLFDAIINTLQFFADVTGSEQLEDAAETGRIGKQHARWLCAPSSCQCLTLSFFDVHQASTMRWSQCSQPTRKKSSGQSPSRSTTTASPWKGRSMTHTQPCSRAREWVSSAKRSSKRIQSPSNRGPGRFVDTADRLPIASVYGRFLEKVERSS
jgi:divinyl chlorophyllide a 8-vinyl-reductase